MKKIILTLSKLLGYLFLVLCFYIFISIGISYIGKKNNQIIGTKEGSFFETVFDGKLAYRITPSASQPIKGNALLIHGFAAWGETWIDQERLLSEKGFNVYSLDLPPFGFSDRYDLL